MVIDGFFVFEVIIFKSFCEFCFSQSNDINVYNTQCIAEEKVGRMYVDMFL